MPGPPTSAYANLSFVFGGAALPLGAVSTIGLGGLGPADPDFLNDISSAAETLVEATCPSSVTLEELVLKRGPVATGPTSSRSMGIVGVQNASTDSPGTALLVRKVVDGVSARFAGRLFWPTPSSVDIETGGLLGTASVVQFQAAFDAFYTALGVVLAVPHVFPSDGGIPNEVSRFDVQNRVASQRRRNRR